MNTYHAALWSTPSSSDERYRTTHHQRTKQRGKEEQRGQGYETTWEEVERWSVDPGRVPEPTWDSMEQCEEGYRRMESARQTRLARKPERQPPPQKNWGVAHGECGRVRLET